MSVGIKSLLHVRECLHEGINLCLDVSPEQNIDVWLAGMRTYILSLTLLYLSRIGGVGGAYSSIEWSRRGTPPMSHHRTTVTADVYYF